ncbi:ABC transporter substrate-binding protein [Pseudonocardia sp. HH130630-07]|uniref:ABC transporter substrate-binding protein n=1 Tax=Pseudonocardia sp. HH130630-07 TaxID=1690815 RepID=UPI000814D284|nr:ABC transporter substrate-binding protein [Pseudonocardia sp. HH130630-07]ANY08116.1 ABC transporter substrate-binding protein [Pseudonocardia sp. HH130630-07]
MSITRRDLFRTAGTALGLAGAGAFLAGCGAPAPAPAPVPGNGPGPAGRGGVLRAAFTGAGAAESLDPFGSGSPVDLVRSDVVFDSLFTLRAGEVVPALATGVTVGPGATSFVLTLRAGVRWHDGAPFTARDVAYSFRYMGSADRAYPSELGTYFDLEAVQLRDELTLVVPARWPIGDPALFLAAFPAKMVQDGASFDGGTAIGTGAFRLTAFEAGRETRLTRFDDHWGGAPPADELHLLSLSDPQARVNAVLGDQADLAADIPFATARIGAPAAGLEVRTAGERNRTAFGWVLNTTRAPFDDPRARRAVRLAVDRQALVDAVLLGYGVPGNDLLCAGAAHADSRPPVARDVDEARRLVEESGAGAAEIVIRTSEWETGYNASTQLLVEQLAGIGLDVRAEVVGPAEFFEPVAAAHGVAFSSGPIPLAVMYGRLSAYPPLALADEQFDAAFATAVGSTDEDGRATAWARVQDVMADRGNTVVWGQADVLSLARATVAGVEVRDQAEYPYLGRAGLA